MTLFLVVAMGLVGVLTAGIASHRYARENTFAQQKAMEQIELARRLTYDKVGIASGNPPGDLQATTPLTLNGLKATMTTQVSFVDDAVPGSYATLANYKKVVVTVTRDGDSKVLTRQVTYIAPVNRAPYGGINNAIVNVLVTDEALNTPVPSVTVWLTNGPSTDRSDMTDAAGRVSFPSLLTGSQKYKITVPSSSGYETLTEYQPPNAAAEFALSASQTKDAALRIYKKHVVNVTVEDLVREPLHRRADPVCRLRPARRGDPDHRSDLHAPEARRRVARAGRLVLVRCPNRFGSVLGHCAGGAAPGRLSGQPEL